METTEHRVGILKPQILRSIALFGVYELEGPDYRRWINLGGIQNGRADLNSFLVDNGFQAARWEDRDIFVVYRPPMRVQNIGDVEFWLAADSNCVVEDMNSLLDSSVVAGGAAVLPPVFRQRIAELQESRR